MNTAYSQIDYFRKDAPSIRKTCKELRSEIVSELEQIAKDDQLYRRIAAKVHDHPRRYRHINADSVMRLQSPLDSINLLKIMNIIDNCDCLITDSLGKKSNLYVPMVVFIHNPDKMHDPEINQRIRAEIKKGVMKPDGYAAAYDRYSLAMKRDILYGAYGGIMPCRNDMEKSNAARQELGMRPLPPEAFRECEESE